MRASSASWRACSMGPPMRAMLRTVTDTPRLTKANPICFASPCNSVATSCAPAAVSVLAGVTLAT